MLVSSICCIQIENSPSRFSGVSGQEGEVKTANTPTGKADGNVSHGIAVALIIHQGLGRLVSPAHQIKM